KGYRNIKVVIDQVMDTTKTNAVILNIRINKGQKVKIGKIEIEGNETLSDGKIRRLLKDTKTVNPIRFWKSSKYIESNFRKEKTAIIDKLNDKGYRDARIVSDSVYPISDNRIGIKLNIEEGKQYYFRNITWIGNSKYSSGFLDTILGIKKGDVYNQGQLESRLYMSQTGLDISSLYMDNGYLFFNITPVEVRVE
ncbi:MAG TPA: POTRA domain-containing protein, partial [Flavobacteriales bacterium]|nr:POTRA domain-containing protein [Flavobacteriales bacterium]